MQSVLLLGATGYLGGTVLTHLEQDKNYEITTVVRPERESCMSTRKCNVILASHEDLVKVEDACIGKDIVINAATSDDLELTKAINRGLARERGSNKRKGVLVHISGTQLIESKPTGRLENVPKYDDTDVDQIKSIPEMALHRLIDLEVARADLAGEIVGSIICPGVIFGRGTGPYKTISSPFPNLVRKALAFGRVIYAGDGSNIWAHVHVEDVCDLIMLCLDHNLSTEEPAGFERFYFAENGEHQKLKLSYDFAAVLDAQGVVSTLQPLAVPADDPWAPSWANKTTARCFANRARKELKWEPKFLLEDMFEEGALDILSTVTNYTNPRTGGPKS